MAYTYTKNVNAYVAEQAGYLSDNIQVNLNEATFHVTAYPVDEYGAKLAGVSNLVDVTLTNLQDATVVYESICRQLDEGDVIRNPGGYVTVTRTTPDPTDGNLGNIEP